MANRPVKPEKAPQQNRIARSAYEAGRAARVAGKVLEECPEYPTQTLRKVWVQGWEEAAPPVVRVQEPVVKVAEIQVHHRSLSPRYFWAEDKPLPETYIRQKRTDPCQLCRRVLADDGGQAVLLKTTNKGVAYFRCRHCRGEFKLRVEGDE